MFSFLDEKKQTNKQKDVSINKKSFRLSHNNNQLFLGGEKKRDKHTSLFVFFRLSLGRVGAGQRKVGLVNAYGKEDDGHDDADDEPTDRHLLR